MYSMYSMELLGHKHVVDKLNEWKLNGCKTPGYMILCGPTGIGKRTIINRVFSDYEILTFHSEYKKRDILTEIKRAVTSTTFGDFFEEFAKTLILVEDVEKTIGDTKFYKDLLELIKISKYPVLMTCKTKKRVYKNIIDVCPLNVSEIVEFLKGRYKCPLSTIKDVVKNSRGDIRSCMNILNLAQITDTNNGISNNNSFLISGDAIRDILSYKHDTRYVTDMCENDFQNISEMLFYNIPHVFKISKSPNGRVADDLTDMARLYDYVSFGDTILKYIHRGHKEALIEQFISMSCISIIDKVHHVKKMKYTKLSIPYIEYPLPSDIESYLLSFKYITVPALFNENKLVYYDNVIPSKELFIKMFRIVFKRVMRKKENIVLNTALQKYKNSIVDKKVLT
jgi:hypothetical protein